MKTCKKSVLLVLLAFYNLSVISFQNEPKTEEIDSTYRIFQQKHIKRKYAFRKKALTLVGIYSYLEDDHI